MKKRKNIIITGIIILSLILAIIPFIYTLIIAIKNMIVGFVFDFRGNEVYGINAFIKTFILYIWIGWPIVILQFLLIIISIALFLLLKRMNLNKSNAS